MKLRLAIPALAVRNIAAGVEFYRDRLGFAAIHQERGFAIVSRDSCDDSLVDGG